MKPLHLLMVEDSEMDALLISRELEKGGFTLSMERVETEEALREALNRESWDLVLSDHSLPTFSSTKALQILREESVDTPFIIVSGTIGEEAAVNAIKAGAHDYLLKDNLKRLIPAVNQALRESQIRREQQEAEDALALYMKRLEQSNRELAQLAAITSHDLQGPLRKVHLFAEYLQKSAESKLNEEEQDYLIRIQRAVVKMQHLVNDLLDLSRINRKPNPFRPVRLQAVLDDVLLDLHYVIKEAQARIHAEDLVELEADAGQLQQLLSLLIENGIKYRRKEDTPFIRVSSRYADEKWCEIIVEDNGVGIPPEQEERIFEMFERANGDSHPGNGVGLAICKRIVERHEGGIRAENRSDGPGTRIRIMLPRKQQQFLRHPGEPTLH